jgi:hypothetical protein
MGSHSPKGIDGYVEHKNPPKNTTAGLGGNDLKKFIPHKHTCEIKMCNPTTWKEHCPRMGNLTETEDECESCQHFVTVEFSPNNHVMIDRVVHVNA